MTTRTETATAADFVEYVADARAEGLNRKALFLRYFRQARPEGHAVSDIECDTADWKLGPIWFYAFDDRHTCVITEDNDWEEVADADNETDESALAWLANQLAERCPVEVIRDENALGGIPFHHGAPIASLELWCHLVGDGLGDSDRSSEAARLRRMYGLVMA